MNIEIVDASLFRTGVDVIKNSVDKFSKTSSKLSIVMIVVMIVQIVVAGIQIWFKFVMKP